MRRIIIWFSSALVLFSIIWAWNFVPSFKTKVEHLFAKGSLRTLEVRYTAEQIMNAHRNELLIDTHHQYLKPTLTFHPYLLMDVKYSRSHEKTGEGVVLWGLVDGEMVINASTWERTHGFGDCLATNASRQEFRIINALASHGGTWDRDGLSRFLNLENHILDTWADVCRKKSLVVQSGNSYRLHLQNPKIQVDPVTKLNQNLVTQQTKNAVRVKSRFSETQIEQLAKAAFGPDFAVRKTTEIYLPIYSITVQNPDGSQMTSYWNALNGSRLEQPYFLE